MIKLLGHFFTLTLVIVVIQGCTSNNNAPKNTDNISAGAIIKSVHINNAWSAPTTLIEITANEPYGSRPINLMTDAGNGFFASWGISSKQVQFAMRPSISTPWTIAGPDIAAFKAVWISNLYSHPSSTSLFATWYSPDHELGTRYVSRYTPNSGWTTPLAFADARPGSYLSKPSQVIVGTNAEAVLFWFTYAENGTAELHARRFDTNGDLSLMDTLIIGQPGRLTGRNELNGWITATGDVELYWIEREISFTDTGPLQLWQSTYSFTDSGSGAWSTPQKITNGQFEQTRVINQLDVIPSDNDNLLIIFRTLGLGSTPMPLLLAFKAGVWGQLTSIPPTTKTGEIIGANVAHNAQGQTVLVWTEYASSTHEFQVFATLHSSSTDWTSPVQISRSSPLPRGNWGIAPGDEPKVSINATGQIAVTWVNLLENPRHLYTNYYDPATGWQGESLAVTTTLSANEFLGFNIALTDSGDVSLIWQEAESSADGTTTVRVRSADHVGAGNGVTNVIKSPSIESTPTATDWFERRTHRITPPQIINLPLTPPQWATQIPAAANSPPRRLSSAWNEPTVIEVVISPNTDFQNIDALPLIANDLGEATVYFGTDVWSGDVLSGEWHREFPLANLADPKTTYIHDMAIDPLTGDWQIAWSIDCPDQKCIDLYVSRRPAGGTWEPPVSLEKKAKGLVDLIANSTSMGAVWTTSRDPLGNPELAYAEYHQDTGWSAPDRFSPAVIKSNAIRPLSHSEITMNTSVLGESGMLSIVTDVFTDQNNSSAILVQRHPVNGWIQATFPVQIPGPPLMIGTVYLSATGADDAVQAIVNQRSTPIELRETAYQFSNGSWGAPYKITAPKKGDIMVDRMSDPLEIKTDSNSKGEVLIVWNERIDHGDFSTRQMRVNRYRPSAGWEQPTDIGFAMPETIDEAVISQRDTIESMRVSINESGQGAVVWADISGVQQALNIIHLDASMATINHEIVRILDLTQTHFDAIDLHLDNQGRAILVWDELSTGPTEVTHRLMTTTHHPDGAISPTPVLPPEMPTPTLPEPPKPSPNWSEAEMVWAFPKAIGSKDFTHLPMITAMGNNPMVAIQVDRQFDSTNQRFTASDHVLVSNATDGGWDEQSPFGNNSPRVMARVQLASDAQTNTVFALWSSQQQWYINHQINHGAWGVPQSVASNTETGHLLSNTPGQVVVVWQPIDDSATVLVSEISVDATGAINLTTGDPSTKAAATLASDPVFSHQGTLAILRAVPVATNQEYVVTQYQIGSGWQAWPDQTLNANGFNPMSLQLAITSDNQVVALAQSDSLRTLHSAFLQADGTWTNWIAIQPNRDTAVGLTGKYRMGTSNSGHLYVMWVEEIIDDQGEPINNVMFSSFDATGLATGNPWQPPTLITQIRHPNYHETPQLLVSRDGAAAIVWEQTTTIQIDGRPTEVNSILVKKYDPDTGWNSDPDIAATFPLLFLDQPTSVSTYLSESNQLFIAWKTLTPPAILITRGQL